MYPFTIPNYKGKGIINLLSSISNNFGVKHPYKELVDLDSKELKKYKNIVLIVIDGLGYNYLLKQKNSFLLSNLKSKMTSTFLSTTACANTALIIGYPPQQHALTGWDINLKETGSITKVLPFFAKFGGQNLSELGFEIKDIVDCDSMHKNFKCNKYMIIHKNISESPFTKHVSKYMKIISSKSYKNTLNKIEQIVKNKSKKRKFVHAYIEDYDAMAHNDGTTGRNTKKIFLDIDKKIKSLSNSLKGTNTKIIVLADHGFTNTKKSEYIFVEKIQGLSECMSIPLSGEPRVAYLYIRPSKVKDFEKIIKTKLSKYCWCYKSEELIKNNFYGLGKPSKKLFDRVGDYVLIMKGNYCLKDKLANSKKHPKLFKANHAGVTADEMYVPLVLIDC